MTSEIKTISKTKNSAWKGAYRLGFWSAILTAFLAAVAFVIGIATPARSGPFCASACIPYPYTNVASFIPGDYLWLFPGFLLAVDICRPDGMHPLLRLQRQEDIRSDRFIVRSGLCSCSYHRLLHSVYCSHAQSLNRRDDGALLVHTVQPSWNLHCSRRYWLLNDECCFPLSCGCFFWRQT